MERWSIGKDDDDERERERVKGSVLSERLCDDE